MTDICNVPQIISKAICFFINHMHVEVSKCHDEKVNQFQKVKRELLKIKDVYF